MITTKKLRQKYLDFFKAKGHTIIPSASLIPENDPTVLFTTAGMHPLIPYLTGQPHPAGRRLADSQKCMRTGDIDEVGDNVHLTFFEMLGNWSLGDYWKDDAIKWSFEFLTKELEISIDKLAISCFEGDKKNNIKKDTEAAEIWMALGITEERIAFLGRNDNWWGPAGQTGPCGPDTEMFYWSGSDEAPKTFDPNDERWIEIWNDVFMQYNKTATGTYEELAQKNVDTGMGLERTVAILNGKDNVYDTDAFAPLIKKIDSLAPDTSHYPGDKAFDSLYQPGVEFNKEMERTKTKAFRRQSVRIIADHLKAATFILGDEKGIEPSNLDQGYVVRRLVRRAVRHGKKIGVTDPFTFKIAEVVIKEFQDVYPELKANKDFIVEQLVREEEKFSQTLEKGLKEFEKIATKNISGHDAFILFSTYGFPVEITEELAAERGLGVDLKTFEKEFASHQEKSRTATAGKFKGGLADHSQETTRLHTTNHLALAALRKVLGDHVEQRGSNITAERLRFDFSHDQKLTAEQIKQVENLVNEAIRQKLPVSWEIIPLEKARALKAIGVFEHKYGDEVKVYTVGEADKPLSRELCGGPHVENTAELGRFRITKEEASSAGVRRIKAVLE